MNLTREERSRILAGDHSALKRQEKPHVIEGEGSVLIWSRARTVVSDRDTGATIKYPRRKLVWVKFAEPVFIRGGGWRIGFEYHDERVKTRFLGPAAAPSDEEQLTDETARGYRSSATGAIDELEAEDDDELARQNMKSRSRWAEHRSELAAADEARHQERNVREQLKQATRELLEISPAAAQALLAGVERLIQNELTQNALPQDQGPTDLPHRSTLGRRRTR